MFHLKDKIFDIRNNQGSALVLVLVIVTAVTIICSMILAGMYLQMKFIRRDIHQLQALYLAEAGIYKTVWYLSNNTNQNAFWRLENEALPLFENDTANISVKTWGGYLLVNAVIKYKESTKNLHALVGEVPPDPFKQAIIIGEVDFPLIVSGKNRIIGNVTVNILGVEESNIVLRRFEGDQLVEGEITRKQNLGMPYFDPVLFDKTCQKCEEMVQDTSDIQDSESVMLTKNDLLNLAKDGIVQIQGNVVIEDSIQDVSLMNLRRVICPDSLTIRGETVIDSPIEIIAGKTIIIEDHVRMNQSILYSKEGINVSDSCQIQSQLLSPGNIIVSNKAVMEYPSIIYCCGYVIHNDIQGRIAIRDQTVVMGTIILKPDIKLMTDMDDQTLVEIGTQAKVVGVIYASHYTAHEGIVYGSIVTGGFIFYESPEKTLRNWLINTITDRTKLPDIYRMPLLFSLNPKLDVIEWFDGEEFNLVRN